jgi:hypothetical protein
MTKIKSANILGRMRIAAGSLLVSMILLLTFTTYTFAEGGGRYEVDPWSFGLMADTQWTVSEDPEGANPEYVSAALAGVIQEEFIDHGVKFVIEVGDLSDRAGDAGMETRATVAQPLYDAGIGFFPLRGNHETYGYIYGRDPDWNVNVPAYLDAFPQTQGLADTFGASNFSSPSDIMEGVDILDGLSYSFDYGDEGNNARFVIVDVEGTRFIHSVVDEDPAYDPQYGEGWYYLGWIVYKATADVPGGSIPEGAWFRISSSGSPSTNFYGFEAIWPIDDWIAKEKYDIANTEFWPGDQQDWISERLDKTTRDTEHAFVLSHRGLMGTNHVDCFWGSNPGSKSSTQNPFYASLAENGVRYMLSGHDHLHNRALVDSPDGANQVQQIIHMAASTKFYSPGSLDSFIGSYGDVKQRETQISQELYNVGYYIYTIDGPRVLVDYYSDSEDGFLDNEEYPYGDASVPARLYLPELNFIKKESYGYSTNGQQFLIAQGDSYTIVEDSFGWTKAEILAGTNNSTTTDETPTEIDDNGTPEDPSDDIILSAPRPLNKTVNTGWVANPNIKMPKSYKHRWCRNKIWRALKSRLHGKLKSHILSLWGMGELSTEQTDTYVLSMSFDVLSTFFDVKAMKDIKRGKFGIATYFDGKWVNAVDENFGGKKKFVFGRYKPKYGLGTYGIDPRTKTAWAVINYNADFAVAKNIKPAPKHKKCH